MKEFYVTFGQGHAHHIAGKTFDPNCVGVIKASGYIQARNICFKTFGAKFCFLKANKPTEEDIEQFYPRGFINVN